MHQSWLTLILAIVLLLPASIPYSLSQSSVRRAGIKPVKIADVYGHASNIKNGAQRASSYDTIIMHPGFADKIRHVKAEGFHGPILQYIVVDALIGPAGLHSVEAQQRKCAELGISDIQTDLNNINMHRDFCTIHDSVVTSEPLVDLDLDGTGDVAAEESWFLHDRYGNRIYRSTGGGTGYYPDPGNAGIRRLFKERILNELRNNRREHLFDGIYLDNVALGYGNTDRHGSAPVEYNTQAAAENAVYGFVRNIYQGMKAENSEYLLWANLIGGTNDGRQWDRFSPILDGALNEDFAVTWSTEVHTPSILYNQLIQAQKWIQKRNAFVGVAQGDGSGSLGRFGLAAYLLITDGKYGYYHYTNNHDMYNEYYDYPEYDARLGHPVEDFVVTGRDKSGIPIFYKRDFECGTVTLDVSERTYSIEIKDACSLLFRRPRSPVEPKLMLR